MKLEAIYIKATNGGLDKDDIIRETYWYSPDSRPDDQLVLSCRSKDTKVVEASVIQKSKYHTGFKDEWGEQVEENMFVFFTLLKRPLDLHSTEKILISKGIKNGKAIYKEPEIDDFVELLTDYILCDFCGNVQKILRILPCDLDGLEIYNDGGSSWAVSSGSTPEVSNYGLTTKKGYKFSFAEKKLNRIEHQKHLVSDRVITNTYSNIDNSYSDNLRVRHKKIAGNVPHGFIMDSVNREEVEHGVW